MSFRGLQQPEDDELLLRGIIFAPMNQMPVSNSAIFEALLKSRRSVFIDQFDPEAKIPDEIVRQILSYANYAPTHKLTEPWRFAVFSGEGLKTLAKLQSDYYQEKAGEKFKEATWQKLQTQPLRCSHVVAIGLARHESVPEQEEIAALGCAMENVYLGMAAYGVGGYWSTGGVTYYPGAQQLFGWGPGDKLMGFLFMGVIKTAPVGRTPGSFEEKIRWTNS